MLLTAGAASNWLRTGCADDLMPFDCLLHSCKGGPGAHPGCKKCFAEVLATWEGRPRRPPSSPSLYQNAPHIPGRKAKKDLQLPCPPLKSERVGHLEECPGRLVGPKQSQARQALSLGGQVQSGGLAEPESLSPMNISSIPHPSTAGFVPPLPGSLPQGPAVAGSIACLTTASGADVVMAQVVPSVSMELFGHMRNQPAIGMQQGMQRHTYEHCEPFVHIVKSQNFNKQAGQTISSAIAVRPKLPGSSGVEQWWTQWSPRIRSEDSTRRAPWPTASPNLEPQHVAHRTSSFRTQSDPYYAAVAKETK